MAVALLVSCGAPEQQGSEPLNATARELEPLPEVEPEQPFAYSAEQFRDPFQPLTFAPADTLSQPDRDRPEEPLERYALESLKLVGVVQINGYCALIKAPDGKTHRARKGNYLGLNQGRIIDIGERRLYLREVVAYDDHTLRERESVLSLDE
jgi:type IV pilus assembly protein PilP